MNNAFENAFVHHDKISYEISTSEYDLEYLLALPFTLALFPGFYLFLFYDISSFSIFEIEKNSTDIEEENSPDVKKKKKKITTMFRGHDVVWYSNEVINAHVRT